MSLQKRFTEAYAARGFNTNTAPVLLAVSGGIDSMVMCHLFLSAGVHFAVGHCNFQLRGADADKDEQLVKDWCAEHNVTFHNTRFDTQAKVEEWKKGIQETARILRYDWLEQIRKENKYRYIATAHHANDNAETLLMHLFKGTGISGLHGIPVQNGNIIRPLLFAPKNDITAYAQVHNVPYRNDASNASDKYLRNQVRLNVLPAIEEAFPNVIDNLNNSIQRFTEAEELYNKALDQERKKILEKRGNDLYIPIKKLKLREPLSTICYELFAPYGFTPAQVPHIIDLFHAESGHFMLSPTHRIIKDRDFLIITTLAADETDMIPVDDIPATINAGGHTFRFSYEKKPATIPTDSNTALIDVTKLEQPLLLRRWRQGDYFYPLGMGMKKKKLSRYFVDQKLPIHEKENIWVLESNKRIVWLAGHRLDERFKLKPSTEKVLKITFA